MFDETDSTSAVVSPQVGTKIWAEPVNDLTAPSTDRGIYRWLVEPDRRDLSSGEMLTGCAGEAA